MMINKRLISMMGDSKRYIAWNVVLQFLALLANIVMIFAVSLFLTGLVRREPDLPTALLYILGALIVRFFCTRGAASASYNASCTVKKTLRAAIYEKLLRLGGSYTQAVPTAEVLQLAGEGVEQLETYFGAYLPQFFYAMIAPVTLFIALAPVSLHAAVILMICVPLIPVSIVAVQKFAKKLLGKYWGRYAALGDSFLENLQGLTTLKIYQADGARHAAMNREAEHFRKVTMKVLTMQLNSIIVMDIIAYGGAALGIIVAAHEFNANRVTLPGALCIILLSADFFLPMRALGSYFHVAMNGMAASDKIFKLLDLPEGSAKTAQLGADCAIACRDLHFGYTVEKETLHGLNLDFPQGSFTALVGESGCGKSTIAAVLTGRVSGYTGHVTIGGQELSAVSEASLLKNVTLVSLGSHLFKGTVADNLRMAAPGADDGALWGALEQVNLADFRALRESVRPVTGREDENALKTLMEKLEEGERLAREVYEAVRTANAGNGEPERDRRLQSQLLYLFKKAQGYFVRLNWHDEVLFPHEASQTNLRYLGEAVRQLEDKNVRGALEALYQVDNNKYAFQFDDQVYRYFTEYVMNQEKERLQWGAGRIVHHLDLSKQIRSLMEKERTRNTGVEPELEALKAMERQALGCFDDDIRYMIQAVDTLTEGLRKAKEE